MDGNIILKIILGTFINCIVLVLISLGIYHIYGFTLKDTLFVISLAVLVIEVFLNISGNSLGISIQSLGQMNSQYVSNIDLEAQEHENINNKPTFHVKDIINFTLIISSLVIFIISFMIF
ncbi:hypothetical protein [Clostridium aquiflavi]|uniref:DUF3899 domain-containing protein n=1 Tax=Clostridium aquiflavi TaxID=3073603 RepID=A0ABU1EC11_9CLOT|nr:hypothetical protein [Clostridium sp. 5N-1]MDR5585862.1 hypothetical protein [Clostridium sp. 5N-1]